MSIWTPDYFRLFLSHVATYKMQAQQLKNALNLYNVSCFVAHTDIKPTRAWQYEIEEALNTMDALAALLTTDFHQSKWTDQEVGFAMGRGILIIPLRYDYDPYGFIGKYQGYTIRGKQVRKVTEDIVSILATHKSTSLLMAKALVRRLEEAKGVHMFICSYVHMFIYMFICICSYVHMYVHMGVGSCNDTFEKKLTSCYL
jgi:hypothetical protein